MCEILVRSHKNAINKNILKIKNCRNILLKWPKNLCQSWQHCPQAGRGSPAEEGRGTAQAPVGVSLPDWTQQQECDLNFLLLIYNCTALFTQVCHNAEALFAYIYNFYVIFDTVCITSCANVKYYMNLWAFNNF